MTVTKINFVISPLLALAVTFLISIQGIAQLQVAGSEFRVNTTQSKDQYNPAIAMNSSGNFVIVWYYSDADNSSDVRLYFQRYSADGTPVGGETLVDGNTVDYSYHSVAIDESGNFVIAWNSYYHGGDDGLGIIAQRYNSSGAEVGSEIHVNTVVDNYSIYPAVGMDANGNFVIVWQENQLAPAASGYRMYGRKFASDGTPVGITFPVSSDSEAFEGHGSISMKDNGEFVVVYEANGNISTEPYHIAFQRFNADCTTNGAESIVCTFNDDQLSEPNVDMNENGEFIITWSGNNKDGDPLMGVFARKYDASGNPATAELHVNTTTDSHQSARSSMIHPDGSFTVIYECFLPDNTKSVMMQQYDIDGTPVDNELTVNTTISHFQPYPKAAHSDNNVVITWAGWSYDLNTVRYEAYAQRYTIPSSTNTNPAIEKNVVELYPNPVKEKCTVRVSGFNGEIAEIKLADIYGRIVFTREAIVENDHLEFIPSGLSKGNYVVQIQVRDKIQTGKLMID